MTIGMFLFIGRHDMIINVTGLCAVLAIAGTFAGLYKLRWIRLFLLGIFNFMLVALNNILYYGAGLKLYLPVIQKNYFPVFPVLDLFNRHKFIQQEKFKITRYYR